MNVGITGHQNLENPSWVESEIDKVLDGLPMPIIGFSSLAAGADQIFAQSVLKHGGNITAVLPFKGYENVFQGEKNKKNYILLLAQSTNKIVLEKEGSEEKSYLIAGKKVTDMSDLIIAVWNGKPARGLGGTADIIDYAKREGKEIIHINPHTQEVIFIDKPSNAPNSNS